jgi:putative transcriptional regulator
MTSLAGKLIVATPLIGTPPFARSVVLMLEHDEAGAVGLILNASTGLSVAEHVPALGSRVNPPAEVFLGGPVMPEIAVILGRSETAEFIHPSGIRGVGLVDGDDLPDDVSDLRVFAGYSGWDAGQLDAELEEGAWWAVEAPVGDIFTTNAEHMWERTVERAPGRVPLHRNYPVDIRLN